MSGSNLLIYVLRRDLRVSDNPLLHALSTEKDHGFTHLLPLYVFDAQQVELSGFIQGDARSPFEEPRSQVGAFWRTGPNRAKFLAESVWDLKEGFQKVGSDLCIRVGMAHDVVKSLLDTFAEQANTKVGGLWMVGEEGVEENRHERNMMKACREAGVNFKLWNDEKYLIDDRDLPLTNIAELSDVFTSYRKTVEPLREHPRPVLAAPSKDSLPPFPSLDAIAPQSSPFTIPNSLQGLQNALLRPLQAKPLIKSPPNRPSDTESAHPFLGGETRAQDRLSDLISSGAINSYQDTRNGLLGTSFSTKLSAYLAIGCITARKIHSDLVEFEDGTSNVSSYRSVQGFGKGENTGTKAIRFELLWRDYMRLCTRKFGPKLFRISGFKNDENLYWRSPSAPQDNSAKFGVRETIERFLNGSTGMGLIDASMREMYFTGYTSNRARQNVASFLAKHLKIDWRIGAEWYESMLVDYDLSSNWGNWQYLAGVGNDPRGEARIFNPVKQAFDYDPEGAYVKAWVEEVRGLSEPSEVFQSWTIPQERREQAGLASNIGCEKPLLQIEFTVGRRGRNNARGGAAGANRGQAYVSRRGEGGSGNGNGRGGYGGRGYGSSRGGAHYRGRGGRENRMGMMDREHAHSGQDDSAQWGHW